MKILIALAGLFRVERGAEVAFFELATELIRAGNEVTVVGSGVPPKEPLFEYIRVPLLPREKFERWPSLPFFRNDTAYEDCLFSLGLLRAVRGRAFDVTVTCAFPFTHFALRRIGRKSDSAHVFVTQNGDWPAQSQSSEFRLFSCDGLVCINPEYYTRNKDRWTSALIPNGINSSFKPGEPERDRFALPRDRPIVLMASALIPSKRVEIGIEAVSRVPGLHLVCAGDGPMRAQIDALADQLLPGRYSRIQVKPAEMPSLYRSADIFLHLSLEEAFGNVLIEAQACGVPVVADDNERMRWVVGEDEFLCDGRDIASIEQKIREALANPAQGSQKRLGRASSFSWSSIAKQYQSFFETVVGQVS